MKKIGTRLGKKNLKIHQTRNRDGYIEAKMPSHPDSNWEGYIFNHRLIMESYLGRRLKKSEIVHHKNGNRQDNRISNLEIMSQSKHMSIHFKGRKRIKI